jgi:threonine dehydrogenase-like Zn-dependent dehydrogenase
MAEKLWGDSCSGMFGYSHLTGGFAGGQAEYLRVPFADVGPLVIESDLSDEQVLFLSDIFPTAYMGAEMAVSPGDVVAVWGAGPVGMFAAASAKLLGAERVIVIDRFDYRRDRVAKHTGADTINYADVAVMDALNEMTAGRGPDACIEAVGLEAHSANPGIHAYDRVKQATRQQTERPEAVREAILACRTGGTVSIMGAYGGFADKFPLGQMMNKGLTIRTGQCHVQRYLKPLLGRIEAGEIDPTFIISHRMKLEQAPEAYEIFKNKTDDCTKVVLTP